MKIELDYNKKLASLITKQGIIISTYSFKNTLSDTFSYETFKKEIDAFNSFLEKQEDFTNIKELSQYVNLFDFDQ